MSSNAKYDLGYYTSEALDPELRSPNVVVPLVMAILNPRSVVDVGCGVGHWLSTFQKNGVEEILGIDGGHINPEWLVIPRNAFRAMDLRQPFKLERQFDLTVCLEVAEHLPSKSAEGLVESLVALAPAVLFSAAIPKQGGTGHVNEQWPDYWRELFRRYGYERSDVIRKAIWNKPGVKFWYRQNIFLFAKEGLIEANPLLREAAAGEDDLLLIHPAILRELLGLRSTLSSLPKNLWQFLKRPISSQNKHSRSLSEK